MRLGSKALLADMDGLIQGNRERRKSRAWDMTSEPASPEPVEPEVIFEEEALVDNFMDASDSDDR